MRINTCHLPCSYNYSDAKCIPYIEKSCETCRYSSFNNDTHELCNRECDSDYSEWQPIEKETKMGHKILRSLTLDNIWKESPCLNEFGELCIEIWRGQNYGKFDEVPLDTLKKIASARRHDGLKWLEKKGFIKEKEPEIFYKVGDRFKVSDPMSTFFEEEYILSTNNSSDCGLVSLKTGLMWTHPIHVKDCNKINTEELKKMFGVTGEFKKI